MSAYLSARESAAYCGVSEKTIRNWIASGRLTASKSAGAFRIAQDHLDAIRTGSPHRPHGARSASAEVRADDGPQGADQSAEAGHLATLVRELSDRLAEQTAMTALWMERARVLGDQHALAAPQQPVEAPGEPEPSDPTPEPSSPFSWVKRPSGDVMLAILAGMAALIVSAPAWARLLGLV